MLGRTVIYDDSLTLKVAGIVRRLGPAFRPQLYFVYLDQHGAGDLAAGAYSYDRLEQSATAALAGVCAIGKGGRPGAGECGTR